MISHLILLRSFQSTIKKKKVPNNNDYSCAFQFSKNRIDRMIMTSILINSYLQSDRMILFN